MAAGSILGRPGGALLVAHDDVAGFPGSTGDRDASWLKPDALWVTGDPRYRYVRASCRNGVSGRGAS